MMSTQKDLAGISKKYTPEIITPHKLAIVFLIKNYSNFRVSNKFLLYGDENMKAKFKRDFSLLSLHLLQSPDLKFEELRAILTSGKYTIAEDVLNEFDKTMEDILTTGIGSLLDTLDDLNRLLKFKHSDALRCCVNKSSVVGAYIRRVIINFDKLTFSEVTNVFLAFTKYYNEWKQQMNVSHNTAENNPYLYNEYSNKDHWSRRQAELFIATQAVLLSNNEETALSPNQLQKKIASLLKFNRSLAEAHFLSYLNYLRVGEFCGAIDSLYHCFDKSPVLENKGSNDEKSKIYRFAALNLAILHYHFGHRDEALASLKESIRLSQAVNDNICLQHALSWLYQLSNTKKNKLIQHSIAKSCDLNLSYTISLGLQNFVQNACQNVSTPIHLFDTLTKSDSLNYQNNLQDLISNSYAVKTCLWQFYGKTDMSALWSQLLCYLNIDVTNTHKSFSGEGFCMTICNIANILLLQGDYPLVHAVLSLAKERFPNEPNSLIWMICENIFVFTRSMLHENWKEAEATARKLMVIARWEGCLRLAELYLHKQDYQEADKCIRILMECYESESDNRPALHHYIKSKILLAEIQFATNSPDSVPSGIMTLLGECLVETRKYYMNYHEAIVLLHIANIELIMQMPRKALAVLDKCLIKILAHGGNFDRARAMLLYIKCLVANSGQEDTEERANIIWQAAKMLDKVKDNFKKVEAFSRVKDVLYLQSQLYNSINCNQERNQCASEFKLLNTEHTTKNYNTLIKFL